MKSNRSNLNREKYEKTSNRYEISHANEADVPNIFQYGLDSDTILHFLKLEVLLLIYPHENNIFEGYSKYCQHGNKMM